MHRILGIVAEYNPLHHGHYHQLQTAIAETRCQSVVIAMSGSFVQRGEPAVFDKWTRAKMALAAGADLVLEIPTWYVLHSAEGFARAGISLLSCCGVTHLSFGSESGDITDLNNLALWLERRETQTRIRKELQLGITYAAAVQRAALFSGPEIAALAPLLSGANNILGIEYLRALCRFAPEITAHAVKRIGPAHGSLERGANVSATLLRELLAAGKASEVRGYIPQCSKAAYDEVMKKSRPVFSEDFNQALFYTLITLGTKTLSTLPSCSEGLENRVKRALSQHRDVEGLLQAIKTKRYPRTRIQRLLMQALLQFEKVKHVDSYSPYLRVLACSSQGKGLLPLLTKVGRAPLIYSARDLNKLDRSARSLLNLDLRAADIYNLAIGPARVQEDVFRTPVRQ